MQGARAGPGAGMEGKILRLQGQLGSNHLGTDHTADTLIDWQEEGQGRRKSIEEH